MAPEVSVVVPYTGEPWRTLAHQRAIPSAQALGVPVCVGEGATVADARNNGLEQVTTKFVIHLDADDELPADYIEQMATGAADVRAPAVVWLAQGRRGTLPKVPKVWGHTHDFCVADCLAFGNWVLIGAQVRTNIAQQVRWQEEPVYEDYSFWLRCWKAGATFETIPSAVYRAWSRRGGRNTSLHPKERHAVHQQIARVNGLPVP